MKALKAIGQVLAAIVYTCIFTGLLYMILVLPLAWLLTLRPVVLILVLVMVGGLLQFVIFGLQTLLMMPYTWIVKNNVVALIISVGLMIFNLIRNDVAVWQSLLGQGRSAVVIAVIITILIAEALIFSVFSVISLYSDSKEGYGYREDNNKQVPEINSSITYSGSNNTTEHGFIPVSQMEKDTEFEVYWNGIKAIAVVDFKNESGHSVVNIVDTDGDDIERAIDDWTDEMWEAVRVKNIQIDENK